MDHRATPKAQPLHSVADQVHRIALELEELSHRMRLGHPEHARSERHADFAMTRAAAVYALFRKPTRAVNPPAFVSTDGKRAGW